MNIDLFPRSAKVPELGKRVRKQGRTSTQSILVEPRVIDALVGEFEQANARELFAPAAAALTTIPLTAVPIEAFHDFASLSTEKDFHARPIQVLWFA